MDLGISISPRKTTQVLILVILCLTLASIAGQFIQHFAHHDYRLGTEPLVRLFNVDEEQNIPTWYASSTLLLCSVLLAAIAFAEKRTGGRYVLHWAVLSLIFLFLSLDEAALIHEIRSAPLRAAVRAGGFTHFTWVIPGTILVFLFVLAYLRFFVNLPPKTRALCFIAGTIFVGGAIGMEMVQARHADLNGMQNATYAMLATVEEFLEMSGVAILVYALMSYLGSTVKEVRVRVGNPPLELQ